MMLPAGRERSRAAGKSTPISQNLTRFRIRSFHVPTGGQRVEFDRSCANPWADDTNRSFCALT